MNLPEPLHLWAHPLAQGPCRGQPGLRRLAVRRWGLLVAEAVPCRGHHRAQEVAACCHRWARAARRRLVASAHPVPVRASPAPSRRLKGR